MTSARAVIRRLRAGIVPAAEIERLSIGYRGVQAAVAEHLVVLTEGKRPPAIFVRGEWGTGKTHLLTYITKATAAHGLASSKIDLNARSAPLGHPQRFYTQLMSNLATAGERGLRQILTSALKDPAKRHRIVEFARSGQAADLAPSLTDLCFVFSRDEHAAFGNEPPWKTLLGADLGWADYAYKRHKAVARIGAIARLLRTLGIPGVVLLCDEAETIDQLWNIRSRLAAYAILGDLCHLGAVCCVFGITERFDATVRSDIQRGALQFATIQANAHWFLKGWRDARFRVIEPPVVDVADAAKLSHVVSTIYRSAYPDCTPDRSAISSCIVEWARSPVRNPRRLIRMLVNSLDLARDVTRPGGLSHHS